MNDRSVATKLIQRFSESGDALGLIDCSSGKSYSYRDLEDLSSRFATCLSPHVGSSRRVAILLPNRPEMILTMLACLQLGITSAPINPAFSQGEIEAILKIAAPSTIVTDSDTAKRLPSRYAESAFVWSNEGNISIPALHRIDRYHDRSFPNATDGMLAHIVFSSGSTGLPKAIPLALGRIIGHAFMFAKEHRLDRECRFYNVLPLAYLGGWYNLTLVPIACGGTIVLDTTFGMGSMYRYWSTALSHGVNCVWLTPSMVSALRSIGVDERELRVAIAERIRWAMVGMGPLSEDLKRGFESEFGIRLQQSYGLSETFLCTSWCSDTDLPDTSVGRVLPGYTIRIDSPPAGSDSAGGEIQIKGSWVFDGYWGDTGDRRSIFTQDGYLKSGDIGYLDDRGRLYLTGRQKDLIIRGGINIAPLEIENVLAGFPGVAQAAVVGLEDELLGEKIVAFVTVDASSVSVRDLMALCRERLSSLKMPSRVSILKEMPLNSSGKIDKLALKKLAKDG